MKAKITILALFLHFVSLGVFAQIPLVYNSENTGAGATPPLLPAFSDLPVVEPLTDPFIWSDGSGRSTDFADWERRRNEIKAEIENYEIGTKPNRPEIITASYETGGTLPAGVTGRLIVNVTVNGQTLTLTSNVSLPVGSGPFPAVIGMNSLNGSIPADIFTSRNIARITYSHNNVTTYGNPQLTDPFFRLYPDQNLENTGQYAAWAWGISRLIDGLELVQANLPIDLTHIGVTGCSYAGKMALFAGAFDERIALTIAQESGGGGAPAWRVSETLGEVEKLGATDYRWFRDNMRQFSGSNVAKLPHDHHELMAMVAPRALLVTGNTDFTWLANPSLYVSARAAHEVYKTFGIGDRFGFYVDGGHGHCAIPASQRPAIESFVEKFLRGNTSTTTDVTVNPYPDLDYQRWYKWWGTGNPSLPAEPIGIRIWMEAECGIVGSSWKTFSDSTASNGRYVVVDSINSTASAPSGANAVVVLPFTIDSAAAYNLFARLNCPSADDDSYWVKFDNGAFVTVNGLATSGWQWLRITTAVNLSVGPHTLTIAYREDDAKLDNLLLTTSGATIRGTGTQGANCGQGPSIVPGQVFSVSENAVTGSAIGNVLATDPDANAEFQNWKVIGGTGAAAFGVDASTGELTVKDSSALDFESSTVSYSLILTVTDGYFTSAPDTVTINVTNANDIAPVVNPAVFSVSESASAGYIVGTVWATDGDDATQPGFTTFQNWTITGGTGLSMFVIGDSTGEISVDSTSFDFETTTSYTLNVTVSDGIHTSGDTTIIINITNENDNRPVLTEGQSFSIGEGANNGAFVGTVTATDADDTNQPGFTDFQQWKITGGSGEWFFDINKNTGAIKVRTILWFDLDFERTTSYSLRVSVSDGTSRSTSTVVTVNVTNENDNEPEVKRSQYFRIDDWVADGDIAGTVRATDSDDRNQPGFTTFRNWRITGGNGDNFFTINPVTGDLIIASSTRLNRDGRETYSLKIKVSDGRFTSDTEYVTIYVSRKVDICHNRHTISVDRSAVQQHLRHGDSPNACGSHHRTHTEPLAAAEDEDSGNDQFKVFPNPVTSSTREIVVELGENKLHVKKAQLVDFYTGQVVKEVAIQRDSRIVINHGNLPRGKYVLRLLGDNAVTRVLIVE
jgi:hypothetical protein